MSTELIRQVGVLPDGVYFESKNSNDDYPFHIWKCDDLTEIYNEEGQRGLDREIVIMLCEYAEIVGHYPSMERYRPCIRPGRALSKRCLDTIWQAYRNLAPEDAATIHNPKEQQTPAAQAWRQFQRDTQDAYLERLVRLAARLTERASRDGKGRP